MKKDITIKNAIKRFGDNTVISDLSIHIKEGEFYTLLGPSGCGKTTLLRMVAGFNTIEGGEFSFGDKIINKLPAHKRNIGMVFQNYAIFPHMNTFDNVAYGLRNRKIPENEIKTRVEDILEKVQISELRDRMPQNMSGGQQQRVALARAIVIQPDVLLMDEPLSNLDAKLRVEMRDVIKMIQNEFKITTIYVTHDQEEALAISDKIAVMDKGNIVQEGSPEEVFLKPNCMYVANFIGKSNFLEVTVSNGNRLTYSDGYSIEYNLEISEVENDKKYFQLIRPHEFKFNKTEGVQAVVVSRTFLGESVEYVVDIKNGDTTQVSLNINDSLGVNVGDTIFLEVNVNAVNLYDINTKKII